MIGFIFWVIGVFIVLYIMGKLEYYRAFYPIPYHLIRIVFYGTILFIVLTIIF